MEAFGLFGEPKLTNLIINGEVWVIKLKFVYKFKENGQIPDFINLKHLKRQLQYSFAEWATFIGRMERSAVEIPS